jgi:hypothetical protein
VLEAARLNATTLVTSAAPMKSAIIAGIDIDNAEPTPTSARLPLAVSHATRYALIDIPQRSRWTETPSVRQA